MKLTALLFARKEESFSTHNNNNIYIHCYYHYNIGCGTLWVTDGIWKLVFPHCMHRLKVNAQKLSSKFCNIHSVLLLLSSFTVCCGPNSINIYARCVHLSAGAWKSFLSGSLPVFGVTGTTSTNRSQEFLKHCKVQNGEIITIIIHHYTE